MKFTTKKLTISALLVSLCTVGSMIKIYGTIALDSAAAFFGTIILGPYYGAGLGFLGHIVSSITSGMPLGMLVHLVISIGMGTTMIGYGFLRYSLYSSVSVRQIFVADIVAFFLNVVINSLLTYPFVGKTIILSFIPFLSLGTITNILIAEFVFASLPSKVIRNFFNE